MDTAAVEFREVKDLAIFGLVKRGELFATRYALFTSRDTPLKTPFVPKFSNN
jgi:hypothetical protein